MSEEVAPVGDASPRPSESPESSSTASERSDDSSATPTSDSGITTGGSPEVEPSAEAEPGGPDGEPSAAPSVDVAAGEPKSGPETADHGAGVEPSPETASLDQDSLQAYEGPRSGVAKIIAVVGGIVVLLLVIGGIGASVLYLTGDKPTTADAGDCLKGDGIDQSGSGRGKAGLKIVSCGSRSAKYKVVGRVENQPESQANPKSQLCDPHSGTQFIYWEGVRGEKGTILCLASTTESGR